MSYPNQNRIKLPGYLNLETAKFYLKNLKTKTTFKKQKINIKTTFKTNKKITKILTLVLVVFLFKIETNLAMLVLGNYFAYIWYKSFCFRIDLRNKLQKEKLAKYKEDEKRAGVLKRMKNLKQFKT